MAAALAMAGLLALLIERTRTGMRLRAGASNPMMLAALGVDVGRLFALVIAAGAMLAGFAGALASPIVSVDPGMGGAVLIPAFVAIVLGGTGSVRGASRARCWWGCSTRSGAARWMAACSPGSARRRRTRRGRRWRRCSSMW